MSRVLHDAVILALKEAHEAYLNQAANEYRESMRVAECALEAIRLLGVEDSCGRQMELMGLQAELTLMHALASVHCPAEVIPQYELAALQMLLPPSRVIPKEAPWIPHCENTLDFFGGACEKIADQLERAARLYAQLTDGGGGVAEIYRAQVAGHSGDRFAACHWAKLALERMCGDKWIEPIANAILAEDAPTAVLPEQR